MDRFLGSDPGLTRLRTALQTVVTIGGAMLGEWLFVHFTHAMQLDTHGAVLPPAQAAAVAAQHHGVLVVAIMVGAVMGMIASFAGAMFPTPRDQLVTFALLPVPMIAGLCVGLALAPYRILALASIAAVLTIGAYCRRFGPRGFVGGMVLFMGDFFGFFLHAEIALSDVGWITAEVAIGVLVAVLAQFTLFYPSRRAALRRMLRSYAARARAVSSRTLQLFDEPDQSARRSRVLRRRLVRLNESALMIDAQLADPTAVPAGWSTTVLHQCVFDTELALTNIARFAEALAGLSSPNELRTQVRTALAAVADGDLLRAELAGHDLLDRLRAEPELDQSSHVVVHRLASSVLGYVQAVQLWRHSLDADADGAPADDAEDGVFETSVMLFGGWLPGSAMVSAAASLQAEAGHSWWDRIKLAPYSRVAIQMAVASTGAIVLGDLLSGRRFYWAVIAAFVTFMGANNAGEQLRKGLFRVAGTVVGVLLGAIGAHLVGQHTDTAIAVILIALFFGLYLMRISYVFMVIGITIMVSQLYVQLDEYTNSLLVLRLEETALGAAIAAITVLCVLPLRTGRVARVAGRQYIQTVAGLTDQAVQRLVEPGGPVRLRAAARELDAAYQTLLATMVPLRVPFSGAGDTLRKQFLRSATAARHYARNLLIDTAGVGELDPLQRADLRSAGDQLSGSLNELVSAEQRHDATRRRYVRSAALFDVIVTRSAGNELTSPLQLALRDLQLIDGAMASIATTAGLHVDALDTAARD